MSKTEENNYWKKANQERKLLKKKLKEQKLLKKVKQQERKDNVKNELREESPTQVKSPSTISVAVPGSIIDNAQSPELRTYLVGQVARAVCMFQVDEVIVFDDCGDAVEKNKGSLKTARHCCVQFARLLQYLECPQYMRKYFFPIHDDLKYVGLLNPLDSQHHFRQNDEFIFRDGVVTNKPAKEGRGCYVNIGLGNDVEVDKALMTGTRVTVKLQPQNKESKKLRGTVVSPSLPRAETGVYWGYNIRIANSFSEVFTQCPYTEGYDLTIGTSEKGTSIDSVSSLEYSRGLIVFGGLSGLEAAVENDIHTNEEDPRGFFEHYLNTLPNQGSGTIRTEEAIIVTLSALRPKLSPKIPAKVFTGYKKGSTS